MQPTPTKKDVYIGILLAIVAVVIWSGNFVIARGVSKQIGPVSLSFYRWLVATIIIAPIGWKQFYAEKKIHRANWKYLFWVSLSGIVLFNTCVYVAGHYTTAINLALVGTTSSPIFATIMAVIFLKEKLSRFRIAGIMVCITGVLILLSKGSLQTLLAFRFSKGDLWVMAGAMAFAVYNILVRKKPGNISSMGFLFTIFIVGTLILFPCFLIELFYGAPTQWTLQTFEVILYLGIGNSVISFLCWNIAIKNIGTGRTVLFGNLIPIFSTLEAVWFLGEKITAIHIISGVTVIVGLILANAKIKAIREEESNATINASEIK